MASKTLDFTSWYELQADSDSDEENRNPVTRSSVREFSHGRSSYSQHHHSEDSWYEPLHVTLDQSGGPRSGRGSLIQQLLDEMDDANQKINQYADDKGNTRAGQSYRSDDGMSLQEFPINPASRHGETDESGCDEAVSSAIAEVSKDFISGNLSTGPLVSGESDDSHISSDNDLRHRRGAAYARYPETAAGLSDSDWNPYITESDTNTSPRVVAEFRSVPSSSGAADSKLASLISSFNPPLCSTKTGASGGKIPKTSLHGSDSKTASENTLQLSTCNIKEKSETSIHSLVPLKPDSSISPPQMSSSKLSEYSFGKKSLESYDISSGGASREEATRSLRKCFERTSWPPSPGNSSGERASSGTTASRQGSSQKTSDSGVDLTSVEERFKVLGNIGGLPRYPPISENDNLPGSGYFHAAVQNALTTAESKGQTTASVELYSPAQRSRPVSDSKGTEAYFNSQQPRTTGNMQLPRDTAPYRSVADQLSSDSDLTSVTSSSMDTVVSSTSQSRKESSSGQGHHEKLGQQVQKLLQETAYLTGSSRARDREQLQRPGVTTVSQTEGRTGEGVNSQSTGKGQTTNLDYDRLHRDLQEIQDSLQVMGQPAVNTPPPVNAAKMDSDNEGDIVPSTTTTPERGRRLVWDYAADLGYRHGDMAQLEGMMSDATESSPLNPSDNLRYTSDGEETRTSGSSVKEHGEEEEHHDDSVNLTLTGHHAAPTTGEMELEELISTFRSESRALESRYQAVRSQGLADKVFGILTNSNPDQQAQGILSEISAEEQRLRQAQLTQVPTHGYGSSYSESSPSTSLPNFSLKGDDAVRKRLDLSTLSDSADGSHLYASSLDASGKCLVGKDVGFVATSTAQTLISAQMKKMADRTFNHSIELRSPVRQVVECYPVYSHQRDQPQYQQLQQELQSQLQQQLQRQQQPPPPRQQQQKEESSQAPSDRPREAWPEQKPTTQQEQQGAVSQPSDGSGDRSKSPTDVAVGGSGAETKRDVAGTEGKDSEDADTPSSVTSPADSDKSSELRRGKYRPYRPAGSQDVYYTESDTASVADSVTTVESTHTGSDDAVGPYFPSSVLGSRSDRAGPGGTAATGIYSKRGKSSIPIGSSVDPPLPTIQERSTPDHRDRQSSDGSDQPSASNSDGKQAGTNSKGSSAVERRPDDTRGSGRPTEDNPVSNVMVKRQARVEDILKERDAARRMGAGPSDPARARMHSELLQRTRGGEMLDAYRAQKSEGRFTSPDGHQRSRIPVRGPPPDYQTALRNKRDDQNPRQVEEVERNRGNHDVPRQPSIRDELERTAKKDTASSDHRPDGAAEDSEEARLLQMIDAQVQQEITDKQRQSSSPEDSDPSPRQKESGFVPAESRRSPDDLTLQKQLREERRAVSNPGREENLARAERQARDTNRLGQDVDVVQHRWEAEARLIVSDGQREVDDGMTDKRREEAAIERRNKQRQQDAARQILEGEQEVVEAVADKRREEAELEQRRHEAQMAREREVLEARKQAEARREAELRREEQARREAELRREEAARREMEKRQEMLARREAELRQEARARREAEMKLEAEQERAAELRREAEARKEAEAREAARRQEEVMRREVELARELALRGNLSKEDRKQQEAEEAIQRAGGTLSGNSNNHAHTPGSAADRELLQRGHAILEKQEQEEALDRQPISHRAQLLREALEQEEAYKGRADLQFLWEQFMASFNTTGEQDSTFGSEQLGALADLLRDPTHHLVHSFLHQRTAQSEEDRRRAEARWEAFRQESRQSAESLHSSEEERAALERELRREEARKVQHRQSSEEESNGSYGEILQQRERDRLKRREVRTQKKKGSKSPSPSSSLTKIGQRSKQPSPAQTAPGRDTLETLYSIPEDTSFDTSPRKSSSSHKTRGGGQRRSDVIDPNLSKLRQRITQQREKIGHERVKELRREQKLLKLKALLSAKQAGLLSDTVVAAHLASISSTSVASSDTSGNAESKGTLTNSTFSNDTTTAKDSSTDMRRAKMARSPPQRGRDDYHSWYASRVKDHSHDVDDFTLLMADSSSQTDSDLTPTNEWPNVRRREGLSGRTRKRVSSAGQVSKHGGKSMKLHQMYSPYLRAEQPYSIKKIRTDKRPATAWSPGPYGTTRDAGTMYPSPEHPGPRMRQRGRRLVSQGVQTSFSPSRDDYPAVPVPLMTRGRTTHRRQRESPVRDDDALFQRRSGVRPYQGRNVSPAFDSSGVAACLSPDRDRSHSASSPARGRYGTRSPSPTRQRSPSPVELRFQAWAERKQRSPLRDLMGRNSPVRGQRYGPGDNAENRPPGRQRQRPPAKKGGMSWFVSMDEIETKPWRQPLKERQPYSAPEPDRQPPPVAQEKWRGLTHKDLLESMGEDTDVKAARFYLDQSAKELEEELGKQYDMFEEKPLCRMSLQEALLARRPEFVSHLRQRQKRLQLSSENRKLNALVRAERERIFMDQPRINTNLDKHPYSENLHQPKRRVITRQEMKELTEKKYKRLPEVKEKEIQMRRSEEYRLNRLRAKVFNKRVQRRVLEKAVTRGRS